ARPDHPAAPHRLGRTSTAAPRGPPPAHRAPHTGPDARAHDPGGHHPDPPRRPRPGPPVPPPRLRPPHPPHPPPPAPHLAAPHPPPPAAARRPVATRLTPGLRRAVGLPRARDEPPGGHRTDHHLVHLPRRRGRRASDGRRGRRRGPGLHDGVGGPAGPRPGPPGRPHRHRQPRRLLVPDREAGVLSAQDAGATGRTVRARGRTPDPATPVPQRLVGRLVAAGAAATGLTVGRGGRRS